MAGNNPTDGTAPISTYDAKSIIAGILDSEATTEESNVNPNETEETEVEEVELEEMDETESTADADDESATEIEQEDDEDSDTELEADDTDDSDTDESPSFTVIIDGQETEVSLEDAKKGYMQQSDYTKKTQTLAEEMKAIDADKSKDVELRNYYMQQIQMLEKHLKTGLEKEPDWDALYKSDKNEYTIQKLHWNERQQKLAQAQTELQRTEAENTQYYFAEAQKNKELEVQRLLDIVPEYKDPDIFAKDQVALSQYGVNTLGFTSQEVQSVTDHRIIILLKKAKAYDDLMANKPIAKKKVAGKPKVLKSGKPKSKAQSRNDNSEAKYKKLDQTGDVKDAGSFIQTLL